MATIGLFDGFFRTDIPTTTKKITEDFGVKINQIEAEAISKGKKANDLAYAEPIHAMNMNPDYKSKPTYRGNAQDLHRTLRQYTDNLILNAIINTRIHQVNEYCSPARYNERGVGFEVRLKDLKETPNRNDIATIRKAETFLENMGVDQDLDRDGFHNFVKKIVRDRLTYDQINFEKVRDESNKLHHVKAVDASTIFIATKRNGKERTDDIRFVQRLEDKTVASFTNQQLAFVVSNPRTDVNIGRYGYSELEIVLDHLIYHRNTEEFNARYFAQGGATRGIIHIKSGQQGSSEALDMFRREWNSMFTGINGAWKIPIVTAEDIKFVNMTQSSKDMEFEKWLNYLINAICSVYLIDPSEIGFPNRGGATGHSGNTLNESNADGKIKASKSKGLAPLLSTIEDAINRHIISEFGDRYVFRFRGGDAEAEKEALEMFKLKSEISDTFNEIRKELGKDEIEGGDVLNNGVHIQRLGQILQKEIMEEEKRQMNLGLVQQGSKPGSAAPQNGSSSKFDNVGKDGQTKGAQNANSGTTKKSNPWAL